MKEQNPSHKKARFREPKTLKPELREQGLLVLARIIARVHLRNIRPKSEIGQEADDEEILP